MTPTLYSLPYSAGLFVEDRLGILDLAADSTDVPQAAVLHKLLKDATIALVQRSSSASNILLELLEVMAYTIHSSGDIDNRNLQQFLKNRQDQPGVLQAIENILAAAINLNNGSYDDTIEQLNAEYPCFRISALASRAILAHEVLGTLRRPEGNDWGLPGFLSWYAGAPRHPHAVEGYLQMLFNYFEQKDIRQAEYAFRLCSPDKVPDASACEIWPEFKIRVEDDFHEPVSDDDRVLQFVLIAANKQPGPGPTGTQEERIQAMSPVLTLSSLICPVIPEGGAIITSALPILGVWTGHNRSARLVRVFDEHERPLRRYILADALPLDEMGIDDNGKLPDFLPGNIDREIRKLYAAFLGARLQAESEDCSNFIIEAIPWGCGAFGGNVVVKTLCMMSAAGLSQVTVRLNIVRGDHEDIVPVMHKLVNLRLTVATITELLHSSGNRTQQSVIELLEQVEAQIQSHGCAVNR